jgi:outer membrane usher protein
LSPYRRNRVGIDPAGAASGVAFDWTERDVVPRAGALVEAILPTARTTTRFVRILDAAGVPPPFGARIVDDAQATRGHIGRDGLALLDVVPADSPLTVRWREGDGERHCTLAMQPTGAHATTVDIHVVNVRVIACAEDPHPPEGSPR